MIVLSNLQDIIEENKFYLCLIEWLFRVDIVNKWKEFNGFSVVQMFREY